MATSAVGWREGVHPVRLLRILDDTLKVDRAEILRDVEVCELLVHHLPVVPCQIWNSNAFSARMHGVDLTSPLPLAVFHAPVCLEPASVAHSKDLEYLGVLIKELSRPWRNS